MTRPRRRMRRNRPDPARLARDLAAQARFEAKCEELRHRAERIHALLKARTFKRDAAAPPQVS